MRHIHSDTYHTRYFLMTKFINQYRHYNCQEKSDGHGYDGEDQCIFQRCKEPFILPQIDKVCQSDEIPVAESLREIPVSQAYI